MSTKLNFDLGDLSTLSTRTFTFEVHTKSPLVVFFLDQTPYRFCVSMWYVTAQIVAYHWSPMPPFFQISLFESIKESKIQSCKMQYWGQLVESF